MSSRQYRSIFFSYVSVMGPGTGHRSIRLKHYGLCWDPKDGNLLLSASWLTGANLPSGSTIKMKNATGCNFPLNNFSTLDPALVSSSSEICAGSKVEGLP